MPPRPGLTKQIVVDAAVDLINEDGIEYLSIAALAKRLNIRSPSLYNHIDGLAGLRRELVLRGLHLLTVDLQAAAMGRAGYDALTEVSKAYRNFARQQPGLYTLTLRSTEQGDPELQAVGHAAVAVVLAVLRGYNLDEESALHAMRCLRSALHGFVSLEAAGGFGLPLDLDQSFEQLVNMIDCGLRVQLTNQN